MITLPNKKKQQRLSASVKQSIIYLTLVPFIVIILIAWLSQQRINDFKRNQISIAESVVKSVAQETSLLIHENNRLLNIFVENEQENIQNLIANPDSDEYKDMIEEKMHEYFPEYFAFTVVDQFGDPIIDDFDGHIGEICLEDIKIFSNTSKQNIRVHPNPYIYHTDSIASMSGNKEDGLFFASFGTNLFSRLLKLSSPNNQNLMLLNTKIPDLMEITERGARIETKRNNYTLTDVEKERILFSADIKGTYWRVVSLHDEELFSNYNREIYIVGLIIIIIFVIGSALMAIALRHTEQQRMVLKEAKEDMFALFSHELRSPLNVIYGTVQLLELDADAHGFDEGTQEMISSSVENSKHMISLINDLLDVQKLEAGMMSFDFQNVEMNGFIEETINLNMRLAVIRYIKIDFKLGNSLQLNIDPQRFQQVLTNLLSNAIKYSPTNDVVTVSLTTTNTNAVITISDNGSGIDDDIKQNLFEKFTQSTSRATKQVGGTGLGLAIVKYIVDEHGGEVGFESEEGKGASFIVKIPLNC